MSQIIAKLIQTLSDQTEIPPPYRETGVAIPLSHCVFFGIAEYRCYTPTSFRKDGLSQAKVRPNKWTSQKKLASEAYRAIGGVARNSIANRDIVDTKFGHGISLSKIIAERIRKWYFSVSKIIGEIIRKWYFSASVSATK